MNEKKRNLESDNRKIMIFGALIILVVIIIAVVLAKTNYYEDIQDDYFVSDETKLVLSLNKEMAAFETGEFEPDVTRIVYSYSGDKINGMRIFYDYDTEEEAKVANDSVNMDDKRWATGRKLNGKYIIFDVDRSQYDGLTVDDIQDNIERMKAVGGTVD